MTWHIAADISAIGPNSMMAVTVAGVEIAIYRMDGTCFVTRNLCTHGDARLTDGFLEGECVECPVHYDVFDITNGEVVSGPATKALETFRTRVQGTAILVDIQ